MWNVFAKIVGIQLPDYFGMFSTEGNVAVRDIVIKHIILYRIGWTSSKAIFDNILNETEILSKDRDLECGDTAVKESILHRIEEYLNMELN